MPTPLKQITLPGTLTVSPAAADGADFTTIQDAIDAASAGNHILAYPGLYAEDLTIDMDITIEGLGHAKGVASGRARIRPTLSTSLDNAVTIVTGGTNVVLKNLAIEPLVNTASATPTNTGLRVNLAANILRVVDCVIAPETATGLDAAAIVLALDYLDGTFLDLHNTDISVVDAANLAATAEPVAIGSLGVIDVRLGGGTRIIGTTNAPGDVFVSDSAAVLALGDCEIDGDLILAVVADATRTGATLIHGVISGSDARDLHWPGRMRSIPLQVADPTASDDFFAVRIQKASTIERITYVVVGPTSPSVTVEIRHHTDRNNAGNLVDTAETVTNATTGVVRTSGFLDATIPDDSFIWLETTAQSGTITFLGVTVDIIED